MRPLCFPLFVFLALANLGPLRAGAQVQSGAQEVALFRAELDRCETALQGARNEAINRYEGRLAELRTKFQRAADLESALLVRGEEQRLGRSRALEQAHLAERPASLRELQETTLKALGKQTALLVSESVPRLVELKKRLTMAGRLDEAVEVRSAIEKLQGLPGASDPVQRASAGTSVQLDELLQAYHTGRERSDRIYKGVRLTVTGRVLGVRLETPESEPVLVLSGATDGAVGECAFNAAEFRVREERQGGVIFCTVLQANSGAVVFRVARGAVAEVQGKCEGWDGVLRFSGCLVGRR
jgi:hypothetical protein